MLSVFYVSFKSRKKFLYKHHEGWLGSMQALLKLFCPGLTLTHLLYDIFSLVSIASLLFVQTVLAKSFLWANSMHRVTKSERETQELPSP